MVSDRIACPDAASQSLTCLSMPPDAMVDPSGEIWIDQTPPLWPGNVRRIFPASASQMSIDFAAKTPEDCASGFAT